MPNPFDQFDDTAPEQGPTVTPLPESPSQRADRKRNDAAAGRDNIRTGIAARGEGRDIANNDFNHTDKLGERYNSDPTVKSYRTAIASLAQALNTGEGPQADLALTYAFAKAMDPDSVVRDAEQGMQIESQPWFQATVEKVKKQFGMDGAGVFTPAAREALRSQIINSVKQRNTLYTSRRHYYESLAKHNGIDPSVVVGAHDGEPFLKQFQDYDKAHATPEPEAQVGEPGYTGTLTEQGLDIHPGDEPSYQDSLVGQGMSGVNSGIASTLGGPVDLVTGAMNLVPRGINAVANTDLPTIQNPVLGSQWIKDRMGPGMIYDPSNDPTKQFARRVGESVGASLIPAGAAGSAVGAGVGLASGVGGGIGAATAQRLFPDNKLAEMGGELVGGGLTGAGMFGSFKRGAQREIEAAVPTVEQLKAQAGTLYRQAEARGVTAGPMQTQVLAQNMRDALRADGRVSPAGRITDVYPKAKEGMQLVDDYSGQPMNPTQMNATRGVIAEGMGSADPNERRIASMLTDQFDQWANPLAPEFGQARDIASRYLTAQKLEQARELAGARAGQFTGSGFENALRTEYRGLDRGMIKGSQRFGQDVGDAIENVSRGTPMSNAARNLGRFAPTGPVSSMGSVLPALAAGSASGSAGFGATVGAGMAGIGTLGRVAATKMGIRNADVAELIARNGGKLPEPNLMTPELQAALAGLAAAQANKYQEAKPKRRGMFGTTQKR